jgi:predicted Zn-dependent protease
MELMAYAYLIVGDLDKGRDLLQQIKGYIPDFSVSGDTTAEDYLNGNIDAEGLKPLFISVDETRESVIKKREAVEKILEKYPKFRAGIFSLATAWLQLHRQREALEVLERYHSLEPNDPTAEYYLTMLYLERFDYNNAWIHLKSLEKIVKNRNHYPKQLKEIRRELALIYPE